MRPTTGTRGRFANTLAVVAILVSGAGCTTASSGDTDPFAGTYFGSGSGAGLEQVQALAKRFSALHPGVEFKLDDAGSETGKVALVPLTGAGTTVAVNAANQVTGLTRTQVRDIFAGKITDWGLVGGQPGRQIQVIVREPESATRASFEAYFFDGAKPAYPNAINVVESKEAYGQIRALKDSIAMVTLQTSTQNDPTIRLLSLDGISATTANAGSGVYPIRRPVYFFTGTDPTRVKPAVRAFLEFIKSPEGIQILSTF